MMVLDVLKFVVNPNKMNIYNYIKFKMESDDSEFIYNELNSIRGIAHKIATFIMRDVGLLNDLRDMDFTYVFPVDTWVVR